MNCGFLDALTSLNLYFFVDRERKAEEERQQQVQQKREPLKPSEVFSSGTDDESSSSSSSPSYQGDSGDEAGQRLVNCCRCSHPLPPSKKIQFTTGTCIYIQYTHSY